MYVPEQFRPADLAAEGRILIGENPFATLITAEAGGVAPHVDHVPLLLDADAGVLYGHFSRKNPHAGALERAGRTLAVFHGPHAYISPRWYAAYDVPTWNYAAAHVQGTVQMIDDERSLVALLGKLAAHFERPLGGLAGPLIPEDLRDVGAIAGAIRGFALSDLTITVKLKANQNRSLEDRRGAREGLEKTRDPQSLRMAALMERLEKI